MSAGGGRLLWDSRRSVDQAIDSAVDFLLSTQRTSGLWIDFAFGRITGTDWSDAWVTGYVGTRLAGIDGTEPVRERAWQALKTQGESRDMQWGLNMTVTPDADSSAWAIRLATGLGHGDDDALVRARGALRTFMCEDGMYATYRQGTDSMALVNAVTTAAVADWTRPHACVTAAVAGIEGMVDPSVLESAQALDGRWTSYWWHDDSFATALAVEALAGHDSARRAATWALACLESPLGRSAFDPANLVPAVTTGGLASHPTSARTAEALAHEALEDGSWASGARLKVPAPDGSGGVVDQALDVTRVFTTATVLHGLTTWRAAQRP